ncbi:S8 family serine peptidase [Streptomyces sp. ISL-66]|nr:S8 family serine peptidase [Streptomyces sp. ISL-66]
MVLTAIPVGANPFTGSSPAFAADESPVDPPLFDETQGGGSVRVNVLLDGRSDLSSASEAGETLVSYDSLPMVTLRVDRAGLDSLSAMPGVVSVTEDIPVEPTLNESTVKIGSDKAVAAGKTGAGSAIAILDTGVATGHPFLSGRVKAEACFSVTDAAYGATSLCPDGTAEQEGTGSADADSGPCTTVGTGCSHGTHVAGIAAGNGTGVTGAPARGVAPGADIIAMQVFSKFTSDSYCGPGASPCVLSFTSSQIKALEKVSAMKKAGTNIIAANMSLGGGRWTAACAADPRKPIIDTLFAEGVATVVAAGNNGFSNAVNAPGCVPSALTVGSTTDDDQFSTFSNRGPLLDLLAPGTNITSALPGGAFGTKSGTSMAAPHVAGALAVLRQAYPAKSVAELEALLKSTGKPIAAEGGTIPRIDISTVVGAGDPIPAPAPDPKPRSSRILNDTNFTIPDLAVAQSPITITDVPGQASKTMQVQVKLTHDWLPEVKVDLIDPAGKAYPLKATGGAQTGGTLDTTYTVDASTSPANGTWKLRVEDRSAGGTGTLDRWSLTVPTPFVSTAVTAIPDPGTATSEITVSGLAGKATGGLQVDLDATHMYPAEVKIDLIDPDGKAYPLKPVAIGSTIMKTYTVDAASSPANGTWKIRAEDVSAGATGKINGWSLTFPSLENQVNQAVPDAADFSSATTVSGISGNAPKDLKVFVDVTHDWLGDVALELKDPNGKIYLLKESAPLEAGGNLKKIYTVDGSTSPAAGTWTLRAYDVSAGGTGTLNGWSLTF